MQLISVIIPVYNTAMYLRRCLDSILNNTWNNLEIICVNDGSTDDSLLILQEYAEQDKRVIVINQINRGVSVARNVGMHAATGDFISFVDSDDWIHPCFYKLLMSVQLRTNADCVISGFENTNYYFVSGEGDKADAEIVSTDFATVLGDRTARTYACGRIYRKELLSNVYFTEGLRLGEDYVFNLTALCQYDTTTVVLIKEKLYYYFMHEKSAIHTLSYGMFFPAVFCCIEEYKHNNSGKRQIFLLKQALKSYLTARYLTMFDHKSEEEIEVQRELAEILLFYLPDLPRKEQYMYMIFIRLPIMYRLYRIYTDRTMLTWEKEQKKKRKR